MVGVNKYIDEEEDQRSRHQLDPESERRQIDFLKRSRPSAITSKSSILQKLQDTARDTTPT